MIWWRLPRKRAPSLHVGEYAQSGPEGVLFLTTEVREGRIFL